MRNKQKKLPTTCSILTNHGFSQCERYVKLCEAEPTRILGPEKKENAKKTNENKIQDSIE